MLCQREAVTVTEVDTKWAGWTQTPFPLGGARSCTDARGSCRSRGHTCGVGVCGMSHVPLNQ